MNDQLFRTITLPTISDDCELAVAQRGAFPFEIARVYYMYNMKPGLPRGFHAHKKTDQILFCLKGSVRMILDDGQTRSEHRLDQPNVGIYLDRMIWHEMHDLTEDTVLMVLASEVFDAADYIRDYQEFVERAKGLQ
jgi:dTDP-4-dehydrorhamnose 3,5-epimerase-like enzyme